MRSFVGMNSVFGSEPEVVVLEMFYQFMKNYNYLLIDRDTRLAVIVDPAWEMDKVDLAVEQAGAKLAGVLITHTHADHINLAKVVADRYKCPIWMSQAEAGFSGFEHPRLETFEETPWLVGGLSIRPLFTPGHTPGCVCYMVGNNLFTGDVLFAEGCGTCPDTAAAYEMFESLEFLKKYIKPSTKIFPGHSYGKIPGQYFSDLLYNNIYLQFKDKNTFASFRLRKGQNRAKLFDFK
ncbi:MBL fold metallo-hydrolase [Marinicella sediminis]|uniref:MBL fold metallo-hydrolase n=1 Tax=Marinicella sediminis TaxID=1792834 RepID=A0ABV7JAE1_9GAMM|nr:MBL fold metallo-hydrolase [Marinicella sediminis]